MTPSEVVKFAKENDVKFVDFKFLDFVGIWQHFVPRSVNSVKIFSRKGSVLMVPRFVAGSRFTTPTCSSCRIRPPQRLIRSLK
jgi:glutamine synthetase